MCIAVGFSFFLTFIHQNIHYKAFTSVVENNLSSIETYDFVIFFVIELLEIFFKITCVLSRLMERLRYERDRFCEVWEGVEEERLVVEIGDISFLLPIIFHIQWMQCDSEHYIGINATKRSMKMKM